MFCYQCEQTAGCSGCTVHGACGKDPETAALQDLVVYATQGLAQYGQKALELGFRDKTADITMIESLFTTVTNVNFDAQNVAEVAKKTFAVRDNLKAQCEAKSGTTITLGGPAEFVPAEDFDGLLDQAEKVSIDARRRAQGDDVTALQELIVYGLKGAAAYADHAQVLGYENNEIYDYFYKALSALANGESDVNTLVGLALECGGANLKTMEVLDTANTTTYGNPVPTPVNINAVKGKAILVSGHDLKDLDALLKQTEGTGINIYTHSEMLPCHGYPELKKYPHLVGNYGGAWQDQQKEFAAFPGAILMTTNCIQKPRDSYKDRIFTTGLVEWPGVVHCENQDFSPVIEAALAAEGFPETEEEKTILTGFGHNAVLGVADKVIEGVKAGAIRHFFLVGGCDGAKTGRNYYTDLAEQIPQDCVILTLACGKYRFNKLEFGDIGGIPRLLDIGQCNDAFSAIKIAVALAEAFDCGVNDLPLSMVLSWYEQKAVAILLTLLNLGIKNIKLGPSLPAFITPTILNVLVENFQIAPITTAEQDLKEILG